MRTLFASALALAVATAVIGANPAAADEPFELKPTQLDSVSAGKHPLTVDAEGRTLRVVPAGGDNQLSVTFPETLPTSNRVAHGGAIFSRLEGIFAP